jgi:hypothetical protein
MPANNKAAAFITKDGKVNVYQLTRVDVQTIVIPIVLEHIDEPIKMTTVGGVLYKKTNERTPCPCCGTRLPTFRDVGT